MINTLIKVMIHVWREHNKNCNKTLLDKKKKTTKVKGVIGNLKWLCPKS
jgi:hypothetical protein